MLTAYNLIQLIFLIISLPLLLAVILLTPRYRLRTWQRLGFGLRTLVERKKKGARKTIWLHGLSVGEVTSALPLVSGIRNRFPEAFLVFSASTRSGSKVAEQLMTDRIDLLVSFPLDILPVTAYFIRLIRPDLFILVETDFWPNILTCLQRHKIPAMLVNGRISHNSMASYRRFSFFFQPLFCTFRHLCMQTETDRVNMIDLGVPDDRIHTLGNLKFDTPLITGTIQPQTSQETPIAMPDDSLLLVAGSTHKGEEEIILAVYVRLRPLYPNLFLIIAPRDISRGKEIQELAAAKGITGVCRSEGSKSNQRLLILDTIGELANCYRFADIAFIGGSLQPLGGHNPIEPAVMGAPVLFGPHMEDFAEISQDLLTAGGAQRVGGEESLFQAAGTWLADARLRKKAGLAALGCVEKQQGVIERHLQLIQTLL
ncbi:MAG: 3-deoxy-D-manno-octulosonic acid transferase [Desulfocapsaceae bacterium]|nr:3-deoxy-D-manno-octulosonic acid transferase [Desulfocapsaceae bacterium]